MSPMIADVHLIKLLRTLLVQIKIKTVTMSGLSSASVLHAMLKKMCLPSKRKS